jgi:hypothetical protein
MTLLELKSLMTTPSDTIMAHPVTGKPATVAEVLKSIMRGEGAAVVPVPPQPGQPGYRAGPNLTISQAAINALSEQQFQELKSTGQLAGLTTTDAGKATIHVTTGGSYTSQHSFNPETGAVEQGRGVNLRQFYPDDVADADPRYAHVARRPQPDAQK